MKEIISRKEARKDLPFSEAVKANGFLFLSGILGVDKEGSIAEDDVGQQTRQVMENIKEILQIAGLSLADVLKTTVYITDMNNYAAMNAVYGEYFPSEPPARATVGINELASPRFLVEIECVAVCPE